MVLTVPDSIAALLGRNDFVACGALERVAQLNIRNHVILGKLAPFPNRDLTPWNEMNILWDGTMRYFLPRICALLVSFNQQKFEKLQVCWSKKCSYDVGSIAVLFIFTALAVLQSIANLYIHRVSSIIFDEFFLFWSHLSVIAHANSFLLLSKKGINKIDAFLHYSSKEVLYWILLTLLCGMHLRWEVQANAAFWSQILQSDWHCPSSPRQASSRG